MNDKPSWLIGVLAKPQPQGTASATATDRGRATQGRVQSE